jgi:hypothetical protein
MSNPDRDPSNVAARYRVQWLDDGRIELHSVQGSFANLNARRQGTFLRLWATPQTAHWHASENNSFDLVRLRVEDLAIGFRGDEGWSSPLAENCFFVIDGEDLRYVPLTELRIVTEDQFRAEQTRLALERGEDVITEAQPDDSKGRPLAVASIAHCPAMFVHGTGIPGTLECTVGLPSAYFQKLLDGCLNKRISKVYLHGIGGALSVGVKHGISRELILCANEEFSLKIDSIDFYYFV